MKGFLCWAALLWTAIGFAQKNTNPVYVDPAGVLRWTKTKKEAAFFGVNYTVPFAYGYRSHKALGIDLEKAIDADVAHMSRLGFDAFRVHVWDTEITDSAGNLVQNEHLRLFDYLLMRLKEKGIKILITPLAFWGNGYPEPDQNTGSFSSKYNKRQVLVTPEAIAAQEVYLKQFFRHVNPYTKTTYGRDPDVIAMEINNEPHHSGPKAAVTDYVNRMAAAVRSTGWTKPVFYNISESPAYADAVAAAKVDGHSFQWYPTGLVANRTLQGNFLPNVDRYHIPFIDTVPAFRNRARMVYEFDAGDVIGSYMYPAMARAFRTAGFQWATQFAYDPLYTAYANTEYQTHYLNLAYTPGKAIGLMIAGKAFHKLPRGKSYGSLPADTLFDVFRVSYNQDLSEMNTATEFYYTNHTQTKPENAAALKHLAGVGSSLVVAYNGTGAYFLDKQKAGVWRLEVLPDVYELADPFGKASPLRIVRNLVSQQRTLRVQLPDLGAAFYLYDPAKGNSLPARSGAVTLEPGVYYLLRNQAAATGLPAATAISYPLTHHDSGYVHFRHEPRQHAVAGQPLSIQASVITSGNISLEVKTPAGPWKKADLKHAGGFDYNAVIPADWLTPGKLEYRLLVKDELNNTHIFPGGRVQDPYRWDALPEQWYTTVVVPAGAQQVLFDGSRDAAALDLFTTSWQRNTIRYTAGNRAPYLEQVLEVKDTAQQPVLGWQLFAGDKIQQAGTATKTLQVEAGGSGQLTVVLRNKAGQAWGTIISLKEGAVAPLQVPLGQLQPMSSLLLPRPYPGFQPLFFEVKTQAALNLADLDVLQVWITPQAGTPPPVVTLRSISIL